MNSLNCLSVGFRHLGTVFSFLRPLVRPPGQTEALSMSKACVLVVEDNKVVRAVAIANLRLAADIDIHIANNGKEAVDKVHKHEFDLILMDISMPEMDGLQATQEIRIFENRIGRQRTPIVAVTASDTRDTCINFGMDDYVAKPADYQRIVEKWLKPAQSDDG